MEVSAIKHLGPAGLRGPTPLLRLQGDERLVALTRRGNQGAYEALVARYQSRLLAFCRRMLGSREDAEDVLQEVFAAAFNAMLSDDRPINVRPWLYRIARNRCLNHLRRQTAIGVDSMDVHLADHGSTTADKVHDREDFRELVADVQTLAETQRTALLLREIDALSYEQIAEAMETTVPSVKSLLVRARVSLAEAAEARRLTCEEVREELGEWAEGLRRISPPVRRHVRDCDRCAAFKKQLQQTNRALAAVFPVGPLLLLKKLLLAQGAGSAAAAGGGAAAAGGAAAGGAGAGSALTAGLGVLATKTAAGLAAVAIVTTGAVEVDRAQEHRATRHAAPAQLAAAAPVPVAAAAPAPVVIRSAPQPVAPVRPRAAGAAAKAKPTATSTATPAATADPASSTTPASTTAPASTTTPSTTRPAGTPEEGYDTTVLPDQPSTTTPPPTAPSTATPPATTTAPAPTETTATVPQEAAPAPAAQADAAPADPAPPADPPAGSSPGADVPAAPAAPALP